ncbi:MAG: ATP-binding cassette domain-containing protein [Pseudomonadota bacterium]
MKHAYFGRTVIEGVSLEVSAGEIVALVGPSGCGKSTLAHIAAGILDPTAGHIERGYNRHGMVFQEVRLLPWATARANIAYPLRFLDLTKQQRRDRIAAAAERASLSNQDLEKYPSELSGGMKQRVAIARAVAVAPDFVYLDEPFTALDAALRRRMQDLVIDAARSFRFGALFISHDLVEAFRVAHRVAVMDAAGRGILGERTIPGEPGAREDADLFALVSTSLKEDPLFRHVNDIDERRTP